MFSLLILREDVVIRAQDRWYSPTARSDVNATSIYEIDITFSSQKTLFYTITRIFDI